MQKSVLVPYEKYKRLMTLQETHGSYSELDNENVATASDKLTDLPKPVKEKSDGATQTKVDEVDKQMNAKQIQTDPMVNESEEPLTTEKPGLRKKKTI